MMVWYCLFELASQHALPTYREANYLMKYVIVWWLTFNKEDVTVYICLYQQCVFLFNQTVVKATAAVLKSYEYFATLLFLTNALLSDKVSEQ